MISDVRRAMKEVLFIYNLSNGLFTCPSHENWDFYLASKIITNLCFSNSQKLSEDSARKDVVTGFKKRHRF